MSQIETLKNKTPHAFSLFARTDAEGRTVIFPMGFWMKGRTVKNEQDAASIEAILQWCGIAIVVIAIGLWFIYSLFVAAMSVFPILFLQVILIKQKVSKLEISTEKFTYRDFADIAARNQSLLKLRFVFYSFLATSLTTLLLVVTAKTGEEFAKFLSITLALLPLTFLWKVMLDAKLKQSTTEDT